MRGREGERERKKAMEKSSECSRELQCVGKLEIAKPKPVGFLCGSIPVPTDKAFHLFNSALVPSRQTSLLSLFLCFLFYLLFEFSELKLYFLFVVVGVGFVFLILLQSECSTISDASDGDGSQ